MSSANRLNISKSRELFEEALTLVPGGVLGARKPADFVDGEYPIFTPHHHGYLCYRHTEEDLETTVRAIEESLVYLKEKHGS